MLKRYLARLCFQVAAVKRLLAEITFHKQKFNLSSLEWLSSDVATTGVTCVDITMMEVKFTKLVIW